MEILRAVLLIGAAMTMGLMAGVFGLYANTIMPGLRSSDGRWFVGAFQSIDRAIINPLFMATFVGALLFSGGAAVVHLGDGERSVLPWCLAAGVLYLWVFVSTIAVKVPMNDKIKAAGNPDDIDVAAVRARFKRGEVGSLESRPGGGIGRRVRCLVWALVEHGAAS